MQLVCLQKNLKQGTFTTSGIASKNVNLPILNNILIKAENGIIKLMSTNLEIGVTSIIRGRVEKEGSFTINSKVFSDYINLLPNKKVELKLDKENLIIEAENYKTKINGQTAEEFPLIPEINKDLFFSLDVNEFKKAISQVLFSVSNDESRLNLSGVYFYIKNGNIFLVGTDSYRLAEKSIKIKNQIDDIDLKVIIPSRTMQELLRIIGGDFSDEENADELKIYLNENQILFSLANIEIVSRLIDEQYPDYKQIIPTEYKTKSLVNKNDLVRAIKASSIFSKTGINDIEIKISKDNKIKISSTSSQTGESDVELEAKVEGDENEITLNYRYLLDGLNNVNSEFIKIEVIDSNTPCLIKDEGDENYLYIIMPIKK